MRGYHVTNHSNLSVPILRQDVNRLVASDPLHLCHKLEGLIREIVLVFTVNLMEQLNNQAMSPSLAGEFIQGLLDGYEKHTEACMTIGQELKGLRFCYLRRVSWKLVIEHLYQVGLNIHWIWREKITKLQSRSLCTMIL